MPDGLLSKARQVRRDWSPYLYHFTRAHFDPWKFWNSNDRSSSRIPAKEILIKILRSRKLLGGNGNIWRGIKCVCFTEAPLDELKVLFPYSEDAGRYAPYGVRVTKKWAFSQGARPVIYQPREEAEDPSFPEHLHYRHVSYDPRVENQDFTWEREWRLRKDAILLGPDETLVIVKTSADILEIEGKIGYGLWQFQAIDQL